MRNSVWSPERIDLLCKLYPVQTTRCVAETLNICETAVKNKARQLGLKKGVKESRQRIMDIIMENHERMSHGEMAKLAGTSRQTIIRCCSELGLVSTPEIVSSLISRRRNEMIRREKRLVLFGMEPITRIKVVTCGPRVRLRSRLRNRGYIAARGSSQILYNRYTDRNERMEATGRKLGLTFEPEEYISTSNIQ